ncbi:TPA: O-antigen translocase [Vibrio vulnificus]|nr:oligosaccharide flippase family protein [Vibrio vulnificus]HDY7535610.1 O-antigen translocase [Vibrio vulnificus]HDY8076096.1 O-antigen translocase [Vibrio vulnificus]
MNLKETTILNGIAVVIKMMIALFINKILAVIGGPNLYALVGQVQNLLMIATSLGTGSINNGVVKYSSGDKYSNTTVLSTAMFVCVFLSILLSALIYIYSDNLAILFFGDESYVYLLVALSCTLVFVSSNSILLSYINGIGKIKAYVACSILGSFLSLVVIFFMSDLMGFKGALISLVTYQVCYCIATCIYLYKSDVFYISLSWSADNKELIKDFGKFSLMALTTAIVIPMSLILIRDYISDEFGQEYAGNWEAIWRMSKAYLSVFTLTFSVYFLPKFSRIDNKKDILLELKSGYALIIPLAMIICTTVYVFRRELVHLLFTDKFVHIYDLFLYQVIGDFFRIGSYILSFLILGKAKAKLYIFSEIIFSISLFSLIFVCTKIYGYEGVSMGYMFNYLAYWIFLFYFTLLKKRELS